MTPRELAEARKRLGLTQLELARLLDTSWQCVSRWEMEPDRSTARKPPPRAERLIRAYLDGYRPDDWPAK